MPAEGAFAQLGIEQHGAVRGALHPGLDDRLHVEVVGRHHLGVHAARCSPPGRGAGSAARARGRGSRGPGSCGAAARRCGARAAAKRRASYRMPGRRLLPAVPVHLGQDRERLLGRRVAVGRRARGRRGIVRAPSGEPGDVGHDAGDGVGRSRAEGSWLRLGLRAAARAVDLAGAPEAPAYSRCSVGAAAKRNKGNSRGRNRLRTGTPGFGRRPCRLEDAVRPPSSRVRTNVRALPKREGRNLARGAQVRLVGNVTNR